MKNKPNAFLEYLKTDRFYDRIHGSIFSWCIGNKDLILDRLDGSEVVTRITEIEDIDLDYKNVWIDNKDNSDLEFDLAIEVDISVIGYNARNRDREQYSARVWVTLSCTASLSRKMNDFSIIGVEEFSKTKPKKPLSGDIIPYIKKIEYDDYANEILENYYFKYHPEAKINPVVIDIDELAKRMGLKVISTSISENRSIFGQIFFSDVTTSLYNYEKGIYESIHVSKNTILVDEHAAYLRSYGSRRMTIAHECVHAYYHRKAFLFAQIQYNDLHFIQCQVNGVMKQGQPILTTDWMEIQANGLAPYILLPKDSFLKYTNELYNLYTHNELIINSSTRIIDDLANKFNVTKYAARKRLVDLGFEWAVGAYNWVDGHYVRPFTFKKGSLDKNETYTVSYKDVFKKVITDPKIIMEVMFNYYTFVENHLCLNQHKFIERDIFGKTVLTDYARFHMDECCIKFKYKTLQGFSEGSSFGLMCYLSRDISKELEFDLMISNNQNIEISEEELAKRYRIHSENVNEVANNITNKPFGEILGYLMKYLDIPIKELEIDSGLNERTIRRYINGENKKPDKRSVVALLRALNLPHKLTDIARKQAGISFVNGNEEDDALICVLSTKRGASPSEVNSFMKTIGFEPLTKDE